MLELCSEQWQDQVRSETAEPRLSWLLFGGREGEERAEGKGGSEDERRGDEDEK